MIKIKTWNWIPLSMKWNQRQNLVYIKRFSECLLRYGSIFCVLPAVPSWRPLEMRRLFTTTTPVVLGSSSSFTSQRVETSRAAVSSTVS